MSFYSMINDSDTPTPTYQQAASMSTTKRRRRLTPDDSLALLPGVSKKQSHIFRKYGFETILDLASCKYRIDVKKLRCIRHVILFSYGMTMEKFEDLVDRCYDVLITFNVEELRNIESKLPPLLSKIVWSGGRKMHLTSLPPLSSFN